MAKREIKVKLKTKQIKINGEFMDEHSTYGAAESLEVFLSEWGYYNQREDGCPNSLTFHFDGPLTE